MACRVIIPGTELPIGILTSMIGAPCFFDFAVKDVVLMGRSPRERALDWDTAEDWQIVAEFLETVGMTAFADRSFSALSGGEQQRVILARALAQRTPCLILDEPTNHLEIKYQLQLMDLVSGHHRRLRFEYRRHVL